MAAMTKMYDVAVIGGGPAGMLAACVAAEAGVSVLLIEKNIQLGKKLLLTGGTRCNVTNTTMTKDKLLDLFGPNGRFLFSSLSVFGVPETLAYFEIHGLHLKEEAKGCVFTQGDRAAAVIDTCAHILRRAQATVITGEAVTAITTQGQHIESITAGSETFIAKKCIIATGGNTYTVTGSTGDGFTWAKQLGHTVVTPRPGLAPILLTEAWIKDLQGLSIPEATVSVWQKKKLKTLTGDMLFTERGVTGPLIHNLSRLIGEVLPQGPVTLMLDTLPELLSENLDQKLQQELPNNKMLGNYLESLITPRLSQVVLCIAQIKPSKVCNTITKDERKALVKILKNLPLTVAKVAGEDRAMITVGGVALKEIEGKTMRSKIIDNLYFAGEVLDLDGPSGGYNLQVCWTTGYVAGKSSAQCCS